MAQHRPPFTPPDLAISVVSRPDIGSGSFFRCADAITRQHLSGWRPASCRCERPSTHLAASSLTRNLSTAHALTPLLDLQTLIPTSNPLAVLQS
eukprot:2136914-Rhodomonas_salina.1